MIGSLSALGPVGGVGIAAPSPVTGAGSAGATAPAGFSEMLAAMAGDTIGALRAGEATAISGIEGTASVQQTVAAIMSAEQSLQVAIAVRDKVVAAYQEISRMAI